MIGLQKQEIWQRLLSLESVDLVQQYFEHIHSRELNTRRAKEINAAAKQAREYFKNASVSDYSVRPLMTYYGVTCLSRAVVLLLKQEGGEEGLIAGHGLETMNWGNVLSGDTTAGMKKLGTLKICTRAGLFNDFLKYTKNTTAIHVNSEAVDARVSYQIPNTGSEITVDDLFSRIPDLEKDYSNVSNTVRYAIVNEITTSKDKRALIIKVKKEQFSQFSKAYENFGYRVTCDGVWCNVTSDMRNIDRHKPQFIHTYINKTFGSIPQLYLAEPFLNGVRYSQLCTTYMVSYILGMLVRYYPTYWISLIQGAKGDRYWPTVNRAQQFVESSYPELVSEYVNDIVNKKDREANSL